MNEVLMGIVVDVMAFFELSGEDAVHPDVAVRWLESISGELQRLEPDDRKAFLAFVSTRAQTEPSEQVRDFLRALPRGAGLIEQ